MPIVTTLNRIRANRPCNAGWIKLLAGLGKTEPDDEPLDFLTILDINGFDDLLWSFRVEPKHTDIYLRIALRSARSVQHLTTDERVSSCLDTVERFMSGLATSDELSAAYAAARVAGYVAADVAARAAARAAYAAAAGAAYAAARVAARVAGYVVVANAADVAGYVANAAGYTAADVAGYVANAADASSVEEIIRHELA